MIRGAQEVTVNLNNDALLDRGSVLASAEVVQEKNICDVRPETGAEAGAGDQAEFD